MFLFFVFYELAIIPKYFLIAIWGSTNRGYGAMKLALYSFIGSAMVLVGLVGGLLLPQARTTTRSARIGRGIHFRRVFKIGYFHWFSLGSPSWRESGRSIPGRLPAMWRHRRLLPCC